MHYDDTNWHHSHATHTYTITMMIQHTTKGVADLANQTDMISQWYTHIWWTDMLLDDWLGSFIATLTDFDKIRRILIVFSS